MYIATNDEFAPRCNIINILPQSIRRCMYSINLDEAQEIRLIQGQNVYIRYPDGDYYITQKGILSRDGKNGIVITKKHIDETMERVTKSSLYSVKDEIQKGYITIGGGHRIGIAGTGVIDKGRVEFIKNISSLNIRIATEVRGSATTIMGDILSDGIQNTLVISPPGCGKTTLLRDVVRSLSDEGYLVSVADERREICAMCDGVSPFDIGGHTTVMESCPKAYAMTTLLRAMSPDVIVTDELGDEEDVRAVSKLINSGVAVIASAHGRDIKQLMRKKTFRRLLPMFDLAIVLSKRNGVGTIERIERLC